MRIHPPLPPAPAAMRAESEYRRYGTLAYLAATSPPCPRLRRCEPSTGIKPFTACRPVMTTNVRVAKRVLSYTSLAQLRAAASATHTQRADVHLPVHASC